MKYISVLTRKNGKQKIISRAEADCVNFLYKAAYISDG